MAYILKCYTFNAFLKIYEKAMKTWDFNSVLHYELCNNYLKKKMTLKLVLQLEKVNN